MPLYKMVNIYAAARLAWVPEIAAALLAGIGYLAAILAVIWVGRRSDNSKWQYGVVASATLLTAPYSMYYELVLLVPAIWFVVERGHQAGWGAFEREMIAGLMLLTLVVPGPATQVGASLCFLVSALVALVLYRRLRMEASDGGSMARA